MSRWSRIERQAREAYGALVAGMDEVGRGPLAGPVVACVVLMPPDQRAIAGVDDSKRLKGAQREALARHIRTRALSIGVGAASPREIDRLNIYHATTLAMRRALGRLTVSPHHVIVDGKPIRTLGVAHTAVVGGDARCYSVACASIVAKVVRDRLMRQLARRYPGYGWERNAGYGTPAHLDALDRLGATPHHRRSFCGKQLSLDLAVREAAGGGGIVGAGVGGIRDVGEMRDVHEGRDAPEGRDAGEDRDASRVQDERRGDGGRGDAGRASGGP